MKRGRTSWKDRIGPDLLTRIRAMIHGSHKSAAQLYNELGLVGQQVDRDSFRKYVTEERRVRRAKLTDGSLPSPQSDAAFSHGASDSTVAGALIGTALQSLDTALATGLVKPSSLPAIIHALVDLSKLPLAERKDQREAETHEAKIAALREKVKVATTTPEGGQKSLTREEIYDLVDQTMRGQG